MSSRGPGIEVLNRVGMALRIHHNASDELDEAACERLGINRTALRSLDILEREGPLTAGHVAQQIGLTTGACSLLLDRLEKKGYVHRIRHPDDRRKILVALTPHGRKHVMDIYRPVQQRSAELIERYTDEQLAVVADLLERSAAVLAELAHALRKNSPISDPLATTDRNAASR